MHIADEARRRGGEYGQELAAALVLASSRSADRGLQRQMSRLVLKQIADAVEALKSASFPADLAALYERAARQGVRDELLKSRSIAAELERRAA